MGAERLSGWLLVGWRRPAGRRLVAGVCAVLAACALTAAFVRTAPGQAMTFSYGPQETLFSEPALFGLGVDPAGDVFTGYIDAPGSTDSTGGVAELPAGGASPVSLPFSTTLTPTGVAVDQGGDVFVADPIASQVLELAAGASSPRLLPFTGLELPWGVAVDGHGDVFVANQGTLFGSVLELPAASSTQVRLRFGLVNPLAVAVDARGDVFIIDSLTSTVRWLRPGGRFPVTLRFGTLLAPSAVAVDRWGNVYVGDTASDGLPQVVELPAWSGKPVILPVTGPGSITGLAVDQYGDVFVAYYLELEDPDGDVSPVIELPTIR